MTSTCGRTSRNTSTRWPGRLVEVGPPERARVLVGSGAHHAGVAVAAGPAEEPVVGDPERGARPLQLDQPVAAQLVGLGRGQPRQLRHVDLALFAEGAGHQRDLAPPAA